ncbi:hypothetical protein PGTUg99_003755 [Puccinia graminis f. sp. tritici]|uniref:Uncharacterized protein n=1 Tax=Puccinia graminis f. sp. tritici TaxID=56615 RepID=A0A5B0RHE4_PUCGR|nr:hypothetical protein PGTUg99_003755 [Puccinia graminis f. sp. tritici]
MMVKQLPAIVGVHWRQESLQITKLPRCASSLLLTLDSLKNSYPSLEAAHLSTDYLIKQVLNDHTRMGGQTSNKEMKAHSGTFYKLITPDHHSMMRNLLSHPISLKLFIFNTLLDTLDCLANLLEKFLQLLPFKAIKEIDQMMKVQNKSNTLDLD